MSSETAQAPWRAAFEEFRAETIERIVSKLEGLACDGSPDSCDDVQKGAPCPYDHAAQIVREMSTPPADVCSECGQTGQCAACYLMESQGLTPPSANRNSPAKEADDA